MRGAARTGPTWREIVRMHAAARVVLHPVFRNIQASWVKCGADGVEALLGRTAEQVAEDPGALWRACGIDDDSPPVRSRELQVRTLSGPRWLRVDSTPMPDGRGGTMYNGYMLDITERKLGEAKFRALFEHSFDSYFFYDEDDGVISCNPATLALFGLP